MMHILLDVILYNLRNTLGSFHFLLSFPKENVMGRKTLICHDWWYKPAWDA